MKSLAVCLAVCVASFLALAGCAVNGVDEPETAEAAQQATVGFCQLVEQPIARNQSCLGLAAGSSCSIPFGPVRSGLCQPTRELPAADPLSPQFVCACQAEPLTDF